MKIRLLSALMALILAIVGAVLIVGYVQGADQRAMAGVKTERVLVVTKPVPAGTPVASLAPFLEVKSIPAAAIASGAMTTLSHSADTVTAVNLVPGEQLLGSRLVKPDAVSVSGTISPPKGLQEVTVQLAPDRTVGARLKAGDLAGVYVSFAGPPAITRLTLPKVLITSVQGAPAPAAKPSDAAAAPAPSGILLVTLAVSTADAERIVFAAQNGTLWLTRENADSADGVTGGITRDNVFP